MQALASRAQQLSDLIGKANTTTGAVARQSVGARAGAPAAAGHAHPLDDARSPGSTARSTRSTRSSPSRKSAARRLEPFAASLNTFAKVAIPTVTALSDLIHNPAGTRRSDDAVRGDAEARAARRHRVPELDRGDERLADPARQPARVHARRRRRAHERRPGRAATTTPTGTTSGSSRRSSRSGPTARTSSSPQSPADRYQGLQMVNSRCPGGARSARARRVVAGRRRRLPAQLDPARTMRRHGR